MAYVNVNAPGYKTVRQLYRAYSRETGPCEQCGVHVDPLKFGDDDDDLLFWEVEAKCPECVGK